MKVAKVLLRAAGRSENLGLIIKQSLHTWSLVKQIFILIRPKSGFADPAYSVLLISLDQLTDQVSTSEKTKETIFVTSSLCWSAP